MEGIWFNWRTNPDYAEMLAKPTSEERRRMEIIQERIEIEERRKKKLKKFRRKRKARKRRNK